MNTYYIGAIPVSDELYHFGIKGQKWGIRRYQNEDGILTLAGKARYGTPIERQAAKDAQRLSDANATYGVGSRTRQKLVSREIEQRRKENKEYDKAFQEAQNHIDKNKSFARAEKLKKNEGRFSRGRDLAERGETVSGILKSVAGNIALSSMFIAGSAGYAYKKGYDTYAELLLATGAISVASLTAKSIKDAYAVNYYKKNRKF